MQQTPAQAAQLKAALDQVWQKSLPLLRDRVGALEQALTAIQANQLSPELRATVEPLRAYHSFYQSHLKHGYCISEATEAVVRAGGANFYGPMEGASPALRPLVKVHPETGRKSKMW